MRQAAILTAALALAGCGDCPPPASAPPPKIETVIVSKEVAVACIKKADVPPEPPPVSMQLNGDAVHDLDVVSASARELRLIVRRYEALMPGCVQ